MAVNENSSTEKLTSSASLALYIMGGIWTVFALITLLQMNNASGYEDASVAIVFGAFMFGNALAFIVSGWGLGKYPRLFIALATFMVVTNIFLSFTDQIGFFDIVTAGIDIYILILLLQLGWKTYFAKA